MGHDTFLEKKKDFFDTHANQLDKENIHTKLKTK